MRRNERYRLLLQPNRQNFGGTEDIANASYWTATQCTVTNAAAAAPVNYGTLATLLHEDATAGVQHRVSQDPWTNDTIDYTNNTALDGSKATMSVFAKAINRTWLAMAVRTKSGAFPTCWFDLTNGVVGTRSGAAVQTSYIESWGGGWYRCSMIVDLGLGSQFPSGRINIASADNVVSFNGLNQDSLYIFGPQFEYQTKMSTYTMNPSIDDPKQIF